VIVNMLGRTTIKIVCKRLAAGYILSGKMRTNLATKKKRYQLVYEYVKLLYRPNFFTRKMKERSKVKKVVSLYQNNYILEYIFGCHSNSRCYLQRNK
jgi:hypothetical protein